MQVPADAYWGAQTQRAVENFPISGLTFGRRFVRALGVVKKAAAQANHDLGLIDEDEAEAIVEAADEVIAGEHDDQFPVDVFQTGSGTSSNMNANEVIANRAAEIMGEEIGDRVVHPNDHVNYGQSSNDVIPTAMHVSALEAVEKDLLPALDTLREALARKKTSSTASSRPAERTCRTRRPSASDRSSAATAHRSRRASLASTHVRDHLSELALGGTAVGTGLNTHPDFPEKAAEYISEETGIEFREADNHFEAQAAHDAMAEAHGALRTIAGSLNKIANDLRLLASGPRNGLGEIDQPENQPGSLDHAREDQPRRRRSRQPGPQAGRRQRRHRRVRGRGRSDRPQPLQTRARFKLPRVGSDCSRTLRRRSPRSSSRNSRRTKNTAHDQVEQSMALATALNPHIGYDKASKVAKQALKEGKTIERSSSRKGISDEEEADEVLDPEEMTHRGILGQDE